MVRVIQSRAITLLLRLKILETDTPVFFGICLGHQLLALASGAHHENGQQPSGANHPCTV